MPPTIEPKMIIPSSVDCIVVVGRIVLEVFERGILRGCGTRWSDGR